MQVVLSATSSRLLPLELEFERFQAPVSSHPILNKDKN